MTRQDYEDLLMKLNEEHARIKRETTDLSIQQVRLRAIDSEIHQVTQLMNKAKH